MKSTETNIQAGEMSLAVKSWGDASAFPVLALHGWQDNAATFDRLAPYFPAHYWVIPDLPGHGLSAHRGEGAEYSIWGYCREVIALADALQLDRFILVGHSMGGAIATLLAAALPDRVEKLLLLDSLGPISRQPEQAVEQMRNSLLQGSKPLLKKPGVYKTREEAIQARANNGIAFEAAALLGERGIVAHENGYSWRYDTRLIRLNMLSMTEGQVIAFLKEVRCKTLLVASMKTVEKEEVMAARAVHVANLRIEELKGGHHQHLDGDLDSIREAIGDFLG